MRLPSLRSSAQTTTSWPEVISSGASWAMKLALNRGLGQLSASPLPVARMARWLATTRWEPSDG